MSTVPFYANFGTEGTRTTMKGERNGANAVSARGMIAVTDNGNVDVDLVAATKRVNHTVNSDDGDRLKAWNSRIEPHLRLPAKPELRWTASTTIP